MTRKAATLMKITMVIVAIEAKVQRGQCLKSGIPLFLCVCYKSSWKPSTTLDMLLRPWKGVRRLQAMSFGINKWYIGFSQFCSPDWYNERLSQWGYNLSLFNVFSFTGTSCHKQGENHRQNYRGHNYGLTKSIQGVVLRAVKGDRREVRYKGIRKQRLKGLNVT